MAERAEKKKKISCNEPLLAYRSSQGRCFAVVLQVQKYVIVTLPEMPESLVCSYVYHTHTVSMYFHFIQESNLRLIIDLRIHLNILHADNYNNRDTVKINRCIFHENLSINCQLIR